MTEREDNSRPAVTPLSAAERIGRCPRCGYPFEGLRPAGHCPECGLEYDELSMVLRRRVPKGEIVGVTAIGLWVIGSGFGRFFESGLGLTDPTLLFNVALGLALTGWLGYILYRSRRHGIYVAVLPAGFSTNLSHFDLQKPLPWNIVQGARINGRHLNLSAVVRLARRPVPGTSFTELGIRGVFRDIDELERFVEIVNQRVRDAADIVSTDSSAPPPATPMNQ